MRSLSELKATERVIFRHLRTHGLPVTLGMLPKPTVAKRMADDGMLVPVGLNAAGYTLYMLAPEWEGAT